MSTMGLLWAVAWRLAHDPGALGTLALVWAPVGVWVGVMVLRRVR